MSKLLMNRRKLLRTMGTGAAVTLAAPSFFTRGAWAQNFCNNPDSLGRIIFGFNVPQSGSYAEEGLEQLKGYQLAIQHINGEGDGGMLNTLNPVALKGEGILGRKVEYVTATPRPIPTPPATARAA